MKKEAGKKYYRDEKQLKIVGQNLSNYRADLGISLKILSAKSGIKSAQLKRIESAEVNMRISTFYKLSKVLGIDPKKLL